VVSGTNGGWQVNAGVQRRDDAIGSWRSMTGKLWRSVAHLQQNVASLGHLVRRITRLPLTPTAGRGPLQMKPTPIAEQRANYSQKVR
jgi:hypothetical protein